MLSEKRRLRRVAAVGNLASQADAVFKLRFHPHVVPRRVADGFQLALAGLTQGRF